MERTSWNVRDSDATLIISPQPLTGGTKLTADLAKSHGKPWLAVDPIGDNGAVAQTRVWLEEIRPQTLNVAGPRASKTPDTYQIAYDFLIRLLAV